MGHPVPNFKLTYEDSENIKADCVSRAVFNLHQIKCQTFFFWNTQHSSSTMCDSERAVCGGIPNNQMPIFYHMAGTCINEETSHITQNQPALSSTGGI